MFVECFSKCPLNHSSIKSKLTHRNRKPQRFTDPFVAKSVLVSIATRCSDVAFSSGGLGKVAGGYIRWDHRSRNPPFRSRSRSALDPMNKSRGDALLNPCWTVCQKTTLCNCGLAQRESRNETSSDISISSLGQHCIASFLVIIY